MTPESGQRELDPDAQVFLRQDSVFMESEDGVFLRSGAGDFYIKGASAYGWLSRLAQDLATSTTLRKLCEGLDEERARVLSGLVRHLADKEFVRTLAAEPDGLLDAGEQDRFAEQLAFFAHHTVTPRAAFRRVREARVAVLGGEGTRTGAAAAVRTLARNGVGHLAVLGTPSDDCTGEGPLLPGPAGEFAQVDTLPAGWSNITLDALAAWRPTAIVVTPDGVPGALLGPLADLARRTDAAFLAARVHGDLIFKGPLTASGAHSDACPDCLALQFAEHAEDALAACVLRDGATTAQRLRHRTEDSGALTPLLAASVAAELATEVFKWLSGVGESDISGAVVVQRADTLETWREPLPRRTDCPACGRPASSSIKDFREGGLDLPGSPEERLTRYRSVFGRTTGILHEFDDDDLPQAPVRSGRIRTGGDAGPWAYGFGVRTSHEARAVAVERAVRHAATHTPAPLPVRHAPAAELRAEGGQVMEPGPGTGPTRTGVTVPAWTPALRLRDDAPVWVPLDRALTDGGVGVGATVREVVAGALAATLLAERLNDWLNGHSHDRDLGAVKLDALHTPLALALVRTGTLTLRELAPTTEHGLRVILARHEPPDGGPGQQVAAGGPTLRAALATALRELAGLAAHPEAAQGPGGPYHVVCPPDWPTPAGRPLSRTDLSGAGGGEAPRDTSVSHPTDPTDAGSTDLTDLLQLVGPGRDALLLQLAPAGLPGTPAGDPVLLAGRVLLAGTPQGQD